MKYTAVNTSFAEHVWNTLKSIDCSMFTEDKKVSQGRSLTYLSWAGAWELLLNVFPESEYSFDDLEVCEDGTTTVWCTLTVREGPNKFSRKMWLPVMTGFNNNANIKPDARDISDTRMRCLVKCAAFLGLGLYIYRGEDLPRSEDHDPAKDAANRPPAQTKPPTSSPPKTTGSNSRPPSGGNSRPAQKAGPASEGKRRTQGTGKAPNGFDTKPAHSKQLRGIAGAITVLCEHDEDPQAGAQDLLRKIIGSLQQRRSETDESAPLLVLKDLFHFEAENTFSRLSANLKQTGNIERFQAYMAEDDAKMEAATSDQEGGQA